MYVRSQKFGYIGHWLSDVNTLEMKNFDTHLFFICITYYLLTEFAFRTVRY